MVRFFPNANYKFLEMRKPAYIATAIAFVVIIGVSLFNHVNRGSWLNYGVDFAGGTLLQLRFAQPTDVAGLRQVVEPILPGTEIIEFGSDDEFLVRTRSFSQNEEAAGNQVVSALRERFGDGFTVVRTEAVTGKVSGEFQQKALIAILLSFAATMIYLAFRFEWRFGLAAVIATIHDTLITVGVIAVFRMEVSLTTVAAVLTIVGYSLNDTIVIFDRIRENLKKTARKHIDLKELLNRSINETLPRTTLTASTTLATLLSLAIFGGSILRGFAVILIVGIVLGTYSSIFIASPILYEIEKRWGEKPAARSGTDRSARVAL